jgi:stalled ribosome alternative rescue factor ArfA
MTNKKKTRNPMAGVLALPCFKKRVVKNKKSYTRKGTRVVADTFRDGSFSYKKARLEAALFLFPSIFSTTLLPVPLLLEYRLRLLRRNL